MESLARLIDANLNRSREALRMIEDVSRFHLGNQGFSKRAKDLRHELVHAVTHVSGLNQASLIAWRDVEGDVGTVLSAPGEYQRDSLFQVVAAAGSRLSEALRVIEETLKTCHNGQVASKQVESIRYKSYTLEQAVCLALGTGVVKQWKLCVLITESLCVHRTWEEVARESIAGGADCLQLREKNLDDGELLKRARLLVQLAAEAAQRPCVIMNDRVDLALLCGADGVHLGQGDVSVQDARRLCGHRLMIGVSTESIEQAERAWLSGADYCGIGPMFATHTKHKPRLAGPEYAHQYVSAPNARPHLAIGGINNENCGQLVAAGVKGIAVSSSICSAKHPQAECQRLLVAMGG